MNQALQALREARSELSTEAKWLRTEFSPAGMVHRTMERHAKGALGVAFVAGLAVAWFVVRKRHPAPALEAPFRDERPRLPLRKLAGGGILATLAKAAMPLAIKYATSKPVLTSLFAAAQNYRARSTVRPDA